MKTAKYVVLSAVLALVLAVAVTGCGKEEQPAGPAAPATNSGANAAGVQALADQARAAGEQAGAAVGKGNAGMSAARDQFIEASRAQFEDLSAKVKALKSKSALFSGDAAKKWTDTLADLNAAVESIGKQLGALEQMNTGDWQAARTKVQEAMKSLQERYAEAAALVARQSAPSAPEVSVPAMPAVPAK